ncbi:MAG: hypothetical protein GF365_03160 [Candidatus Buchananbacteria bacterium]|nr:hypothetical protein [Candidatus Buchananbacteria bacterium]
MSDGIYNRICPNCREANSNIGIMEPHEQLNYPGWGVSRRSLSDES